MKKVSLTFQDIAADIGAPIRPSRDWRSGGRSTKQSAPRDSGKTFLFSLKVGPHEAVWKVEGNRHKRTISLSGDASRTFFGHDMLISRNEHQQMAALVKILRAALAGAVAGLEVPLNNIVLVNEASIVRHFAVGDIEAQRDAMNKIYRNLVARFEGDVRWEGETLTSPGMLTIRRRGVGEVLRIHSATDMRNLSLWIFEQDAPHKEVSDAYDRHLRFEFILGKKFLAKQRLDSTADWHDSQPVSRCLDHLFESYGFSVHRRSDLAGRPNETQDLGLAPGEINALIDDWRREKRICGNDVWGSSLRKAKEFLAKAGFDIFIAPKHHHWLAHGLHDLLKPESAAIFSPGLRANDKLFGRWWESDETVASIPDNGMVEVGY